MAETNLDAVTKLLAAAETDDALQAELSAAKDLATIVQIGKSRGYDFTAEDVQAVASASAAETDELSDEDLDGVSGGVFRSPSLRSLSPTYSSTVPTSYDSEADEAAEREERDAAQDDATLEDDHGTEWEKPVPEEEADNVPEESKSKEEKAEENVNESEDDQRPTERAEDSKSAQRESNSADADEEDTNSTITDTSSLADSSASTSTLGSTTSSSTNFESAQTDSSASSSTAGSTTTNSGGLDSNMTSDSSMNNF